jgi:hypothetical protein
MKAARYAKTSWHGEGTTADSSDRSQQQKRVRYPASTDADETPRAPQGSGVLSFRKEQPWSWQQLSELSLPGMMSDNQ